MRKTLYFLILFLTTLSTKTSLHAVTRPDSGSYLVLNCAPTGLGAVFSSVLVALDIYDQGGYAGIKIDLNSGFYLDPDYGPNWWEYFFEPIEIGDPSAPHHIFNSNEISCMINQGFPMSRKRAKKLIDKYVHLKPEISKEIDTFVKKYFKGHYVIGVHYRGTDKKRETPPIPYETYFTRIDRLMNKAKQDKPIIFTATDDQGFLDRIKSLYRKKVVYNDFVRSDDEKPLHYSKTRFKSNYQKGKEALIDCILLSKCNILLFPAASAFSMLSLKFNPGLPGVPLSAAD